MTLITPDERISKSADLLRSLEDELGELRRQAQDLRKQLRAGEDADLVDGSRRVDKASGLIRSCKKAEETLNECYNKQAGIAQGGYALDLEEARSEIGCRLARLRACGGAG